MTRFRTLRPGRLPYREALALQESLLESRLSEDEDVLLLLEHEPVVTLGRGAREENLLFSVEQLARKGVDCLRVGRGGDVTFHGPGQVVGYPIVDLELLGRDVHRFLRRLEAVLIDTLEAFAVNGERVEGKTGVWVDGGKVASIGIGVRRWVSWHGFALNVASDLSGFSTIVPCGLQGVSMTSLEGLLGRPIALEEVEAQIICSYSKVFSSEHAGDYEEKHSAKTGLA